MLRHQQAASYQISTTACLHPDHPLKLLKVSFSSEFKQHRAVILTRMNASLCLGRSQLLVYL